jgi:teichoic acid transport system ATP-binding protein
MTHDLPEAMIKQPETHRDATIDVRDIVAMYKVRTQRGASGVANLRARTVGSINEVHALRGVSFTAYQGESIAIVGRNGAGKSTLLRIMSGLQRPTAGEVLAVEHPTLLGVDAALMPQISGARNITLGCLALGMTPAEVEEIRPSIIEMSGIKEFIHNPLNTYSSGMKARLRFAISTARTPRLLMVDEALSTGDEVFRGRSEERIRSVLDGAGTVLIVSHSMVAVQDLCTRGIWLHEGRVHMDGPIMEVSEKYRSWALAEDRRQRGLDKNQ